MDTMRSAGKRGLVLAPVAALLLSVAALLLGNGLLSTLLIVRAGHKGFSTGAISAMMSFYFAGFTIGALVLPPIIVSVGHVRTFAGFAAIASMTALLHVAFVEPIAWMPLRLITGFAYAGMILATESWLNAHALPSTRGQLLSIFGVVSMGSWAIGQALLNIAPPADVTLFLIVSLLISAAVVPITLLPSHPPAQVDRNGSRSGTSSSYHLSLRLALSWPAWLSVVSGAWARTSPRASASMWAVSPPSWLRFLVERSPSIGHSVGFRIECPGILSSPVRRWRPQRLPSA